MILRDLGDGLVLRRSTRADTAELIDFNARIHSDFGFDLPDEKMAAWTRDLMERPHPTFDPSDFTLVEDTRTGRIVSAANLISQTWTYGGVPFGVGRPELIGTLPEYRRRGLVRAQMAILHQWSADRGQQVQAISGIPFYYRQFDYEMALPLQGGRSGFEPHIPTLKPGETDPFHLRLATSVDIPFLSGLYDRAAAERDLVACVRDAAQWRYELEGQCPDNLNRRVLVVIESVQGEPVGFLAHFPALCEGGGWLAATAYEVKAGASWLAVSPSVLRYLWATGAAYAGGAPEGRPLQNITFLFGGEHPAYEACAGRLPHGWPPYAWYIRLPNLTSFISRVAPVLEARLDRSIAAGHTGELELSFYRDGLRLRLVAGRLAGIEAWQPPSAEDGDAAFPNRCFLQLLFGYRSLAELAHAYPDCQVHEDDGRVLLNALFPKQPSNVWPIS